MKKVFQGRPVVPGAVQAPAVVSHGGFNTLASFQKSLLAKAKEAVCGDQNNADLYNKPLTGRRSACPRPSVPPLAGWCCTPPAPWGWPRAAMLFSEPIDSLAAAGAILADVWTDHSMPTVDNLGEDFLAYVKDGMTISVAADGTVTVEG